MSCVVQQIERTRRAAPFVDIVESVRLFDLGEEEVIAEEIIRSLSHSPELNVISRLSTTAFRDRDSSITDTSLHLHFEEAAALAARSLRANRTHTSTLRVLAPAQCNLGAHALARATARELLRLEPQLTVSAWLARSPSAAYPIGREWAEVLRQVGLPQ